MSDSGESQAQDDSDEDIYKDFSNFNFGDELDKLEQSKETIAKEALDLSEKLKVLAKENEEIKKSNEILKKNMSSLLKTAQAEIQRKDLMIEKLRNKIDSFTFKRKNKITKDTCTSTEDLKITVKMKNGFEKNVNLDDKKRSKSKESRISSDGERKLYQKEKKRKESEEKKERLNCDNDRKFEDYSDCSTRKSWHSVSSKEPYKIKESHYRKSTKRSDPDYRSFFSDYHKYHVKYNLLDRKNSMRYSDRRYTYRRRSERMEESEKRRKDKREASESFQWKERFRKDKSRSRERSRNSQESSLDALISRSSLEEESNSRIKDVSNNLKEPNSVKLDSEDSKSDELKSNIKAKRIPKDENSSKDEKPNESDKFSTKSPLDALYNEMMTCRNANRFSKLGPGVTKSEIDVEDRGAKTDRQKISGREEDWTLSFKNERRDTVKPMTLYSKRMMQRLSETNKSEYLSTEEKSVTEDDVLKKVKEDATEKEAGELTDDENVVESSKEFQELTKVASIESDELTKPEEFEFFKEPMAKESPIVKNKPEAKSKVEESQALNEAHPEICDVIEFSPFKNNYKLIEISPVKAPNKEHLMELYHKRASTDHVQKEVESSIFNLLSTLSGVPLAPNNSEISKRKRNSESEPESKKLKLDGSPRKRTRRQNSSANKSEKCESKLEPEFQAGSETKVKEDITTFEFFKPIAKKDTLDMPTECKMTAMSVANIVCLETPNKGVTNVKNLMINEQMILNVLDSKNSTLCSPLMTPRRLLKNDLMLTDSEDDSCNKGNVEEVDEEEEEMSESENSECESDSGASDFVDLL